MRVRGDLEVAFGSVKGPSRIDNQDDFLVYEPDAEADFQTLGRLLAVADGMGGGPAGGEASRVALRAFLSAFLDSGEAAERAPNRLERAFAAACEAVAAEVRRNRALDGMGTTLTAVAIRGAHVEGVHVGDSRCLLVHEGHSRWLTGLHLSGPDEHRLTRAVGAGSGGEEPEVFRTEMHPGDTLMLMTDGFWRAIDEAECLTAVAERDGSDAVAYLLRRAQEADGSDNASLVIARRVEAAGATAERRDVEEVEAETVRPLLVPDVRTRRFALLWPVVLLLLGVSFGIASWFLR